MVDSFGSEQGSVAGACNQGTPGFAKVGHILDQRFPTFVSMRASIFT